MKALERVSLEKSKNFGDKLELTHDSWQFLDKAPLDGCDIP